MLEPNTNSCGYRYIDVLVSTHKRKSSYFEYKQELSVFGHLSSMVNSLLR